MNSAEVEILSRRRSPTSAGYVTKPLRLGEFLEKIESLRRYWTFTSEIPAA
jgi:hypothetical protein